MYEAFYGLARKPFQLNADPAFYFGSTPHRKAMAYLQYGLHQNEGFVVITGEVGAGKTLLVRSLLKDLDPAQVVAATLVSTQVGADDMLRMVAAAFGIRSQDADKAALLLDIEIFLTSVLKQGKRCLLVVDEAQNLSARAVEELRMLSNFQIGTHSLLQSFLVGQVEFRNLLQSPGMRQLSQRVIAACHLGALDAAETRAYIEHRLACAGAHGGLEFSPEVLEAVFDASRGIPRRINALCDRLLLGGFLADKREFSAADVAAVSAEFDDELRPTGVAAPRAPDDLAATLERLELSLRRLEAAGAECRELLVQVLEARTPEQAVSRKNIRTEPLK